jgi:hypothetical protein
LINAAIEIGRIANDIGGSLVILAYYADGDDCGITPTILMELMECDTSRFMEGLSMLDAAGSRCRPDGGYRDRPRR